MPPHQRGLSLKASAVKSRRIRSARAAVAGSGMAVFFNRFAAQPCRPDCHISRETFISSHALVTLR
jgi:hypothetical protein